MSESEWARLIYLSLIAIAVGGWALAEMRGRLHQTLRYILIWVLIGLGLVGGYGLWQERGAGLIGRQQATDERVETTRDADGHFRLLMEIGGQSLIGMVDTGATDFVLSLADARKLGLDTQSLEFSGTADTANGTVPTASVTLGRVTLGPFEDRNLMVSVNGAEMGESLIGMTYLSRFDVEIKGDLMVLTRR